MKRCADYLGMIVCVLVAAWVFCWTFNIHIWWTGEIAACLAGSVFRFYREEKTAARKQWLDQLGSVGPEGSR